MPDSGFPQADAESDFVRQRRRRALARIAARLRSEPDDVSVMLPFEEVVAALGRRGGRSGARACTRGAHCAILRRETR